MSNKTQRLARVLVCAFSMIVLPAMVAAQNDSQSNEMSVEQLEMLVAEQKAELEEVIANRSETQVIADQLREKLAESEDRRESVQQELETLCREREELQADSFEECMNKSDG